MQKKKDWTIIMTCAERIEQLENQNNELRIQNKKLKAELDKYKIYCENKWFDYNTETLESQEKKTCNMWNDINKLN